MGLSEYLNELLGKKESSKPINKDFRSVYDDGKMATTIDRVEGSLAKLHAQVANVITVDLSDGEVSSDYSIIKQDGIRGIALCKVEDYGNITIELELGDGVPRQLKCTATYYSDANYREVRQSDEWFSVIFLREEFNL